VGTASKKKQPAESSAYPSRRALRYQQKQAQVRRRIIAAISAGLIVVAVVLVVVVSGGDGESTTPFDGSTLNLVLGDYVIQGDLTAPAGPVRLLAITLGGIPHNVGIRGGRISGEIKTGDSLTLDIGTLAPGTYQLYCDIVGHVEKGMVADLVITDAQPTTIAGAPSTT
jgi:hypothetical protein